MVGLGEPRQVRAGVVNGNYFDVMGLRPVLGRLLEAGRRWAGGRGRRGPDAPLLDDGAPGRSDGPRQDDPARHALGRDRRRARAVGAVSGGNRAHRQRRHQPASPVGDDGHRTRASDDGDVRPAGARRRRRARPRGAARRARRHRQRAPRGVSAAAPISGSTPSGCAIRSRRARGRCCWCCWPPRPWSS